MRTAWAANTAGTVVTADGRPSTARLPQRSSRACSTSSSRSTDDNRCSGSVLNADTMRSNRPTSAWMLSASKMSVRNSTITSSPSGSPSPSQRSPSENARSMRAVWVSTVSGVTCRSPRASPAASPACQEKFCQPSSTWTTG
ncbi:Uncharacterised protein [Mycobacteroides abscessus subsp. abscessus]|nr:Uncharacterised protein [Mycobacteroides abscessus subsp. abscessus]